MTNGDVLAYILSQLDGDFGAVGADPSAAPHEFDLLGEGIIDSFGYLELVSAIEHHFNIELDFSDMPADQLTRLGPLTEYVSNAVLARDGVGRDISANGHYGDGSRATYPTGFNEAAN